MTNKHKIFSVSLFMAIVVIAIVSIFVDSILFADIAQAITLPLLILSVVTFFTSTYDTIINRCNLVISAMELMLPDAKSVLEWENWRLDAYESNDEYRKNFEENVLRADGSVKSIQIHLETNKIIVSYLNPIGKILSVIYILALSIFIIFGFLASLIAQCFSFISLPIFVFSAIIIIIANVLFSEEIATRIIIYLFEKLKFGNVNTEGDNIRT